MDTNPRAWDAASANCQELGGQLASINSPDRQLQIFEMMGFDPQASAGKISIYRAEGIRATLAAKF